MGGYKNLVSYQYFQWWIQEGDFKGRTASRSNLSFIFMQFSAKTLPGIRLEPLGFAPPLENLDPPLISRTIPNSILFSWIFYIILKQPIIISDFLGNTAKMKWKNHLRLEPTHLEDKIRCTWSNAIANYIMDVPVLFEFFQYTKGWLWHLQLFQQAKGFYQVCNWTAVNIIAISKCTGKKIKTSLECPWYIIFLNKCFGCLFMTDKKAFQSEITCFPAIPRCKGGRLYGEV